MTDNACSATSGYGFRPAGARIANWISSYEQNGEARRISSRGEPSHPAPSPAANSGLEFLPRLTNNLAQPMATCPRGQGRHEAGNVPGEMMRFVAVLQQPSLLSYDGVDIITHAHYNFCLS
jgi:hypothetical protein